MEGNKKYSELKSWLAHPWSRVLDYLITVFASPAQYWFELSSYPPSEHLIKELETFFKPSKRDGKSKNSWWDTDVKCLLKQDILAVESWHTNPRGTGHHLGTMKQQVMKNKAVVEAGGHLGAGFSFLWHSQLRGFSPESCDLLLPHQSERAQLLTCTATHTRLLCACSQGSKQPELMRNTCPLLWKCSLSSPIHCFVSTA